MDCPVCGERLKEIDRSGVMVDICPSCKGIWLDRGEIDKIIGVEGKQGNVVSSTQERGDSVNRSVETIAITTITTTTTVTTKITTTTGAQAQTSGGKKRRSSFLQDILGGLGE